MPFSEPALRATLGRLATNFPASFAGEQVSRDTLALWAELLMQQVWVDDAILRRAATRLMLTETSPYLPNMARVLEYLREARDELQRETTRALPPPTRRAMSLEEYGSARFDRGIAMGKARLRKRFALIDAYRAATKSSTRSGVPEDVWRGRDTPTEDEVDAVLRQMERRGELRAPLAEWLAWRGKVGRDRAEVFGEEPPGGTASAVPPPVAPSVAEWPS